MSATIAPLARHPGRRFGFERRGAWTAVVLVLALLALWGAGRGFQTLAERDSLAPAGGQRLELGESKRFAVTVPAGWWNDRAQTNDERAVLRRGEVRVELAPAAFDVADGRRYLERTVRLLALEYYSGTEEPVGSPTAAAGLETAAALVRGAGQEALVQVLREPSRKSGLAAVASAPSGALEPELPAVAALIGAVSAR